MIIPNIWKNQKCSNHQPVIRLIRRPIYGFTQVFPHKAIFGYVPNLLIFRRIPFAFHGWIKSEPMINIYTDRTYNQDLGPKNWRECSNIVPFHRKPLDHIGSMYGYFQSIWIHFIQRWYTGSRSPRLQLWFIKATRRAKPMPKIVGSSWGCGGESQENNTHTHTDILW